MCQPTASFHQPGQLRPDCRSTRNHSLALIAGLAAMLLFSDSNTALADDPASIARALQSRFWWADVGTFQNRPFGYLYMFGTQTQPTADGWYTGQRVTFKGMASVSTRLGIAWKPTSNGVIIDHGFRREVIIFTQYYSSVEVLAISGGDAAYWATTRSPYCPQSIRNYYYQ